MVPFYNCLVSLGANLPWNGHAPQATVLDALTALQNLGVVTARSGLWRSPAWPDASAPAYINAVARLETSLDGADLLERLQALEARFGRVRGERWASRTLDLDIVAMDDRISDDPVLTLPHPRAHERGFVLAPLRDVAPLWRHPKTGRSVDALWAGLGDARRWATRFTETQTA